MAKNSAIEWTDHTFNPWWGCAKVSPACDNCYALRDATRHAPGQILWGEGSTRRTFGQNHWTEPYRWARQAKKNGDHAHRPRVFCASMADVFDNHPDCEPQRQRLWAVIEGTPELDWLLLTKRIGNARKMLPPSWIRSPRPNVWLGSSVVTQPEAARDIPRLLATPAVIHFISAEPLLEALDLSRWLGPQCQAGSIPHPWGGGMTCPYCMGERRTGGCRPLNWVIVGGESGPNARPMNPRWVEAIRADCEKTSTAFFFKQWGEWMPDRMRPAGTDGVAVEFVEGEQMARVGKKRAGRELPRDGRGEVWSQFPEGEGR